MKIESLMGKENRKRYEFRLAFNASPMALAVGVGMLILGLMVASGVFGLLQFAAAQAFKAAAGFATAALFVGGGYAFYKVARWAYARDFDGVEVSADRQHIPTDPAEEK